MTRGLALRVVGRLSSSLARDRPLHTKVAQNGYRMYQQQVVGTSRTFGVQFNSGGTKATVPRRLSVLGGASMARHFSGKGWGPQSVMEKGKQLLGGGASGGGWRSKIPTLVKLPKLGSGADLRQAMSEKVLSFWQQNRHIIIGAAFSVAVYYVWRTTYGIASMFIDLTETFAELGFLALAVALAGAGCLWIRERARINPDKLFRLAMTRLNTSPSVLGVMGAPLTGSHLQASVQSGGGLRVKGRFGSGGLKVRSTRLHMIYPVSGPDARGVVSIEAKKKRGRHQFKLLAIDVVTKAGREERIFLEGNESYYRRGGVLSELRDPFLKVAAAQTMYEIEDDEEEEEARAIAESSQQSGMNTTVGAQQELKQLYFYEWAWEYAMTQLASLRSAGRAKPVKSAQSRH